MSEINDGGPAFPHAPVYVGVEEGWATQNGMTLRDYFAAQALAALGSHYAVKSRGIPWLVEHAFMVADAMLEARGAK